MLSAGFEILLPYYPTYPITYTASFPSTFTGEYCNVCTKGFCYGNTQIAKVTPSTSRTWQDSDLRNSKTMVTELRFAL